MSNEGFTPTDEKAPQASNEAFVPANKLDEFNQLVEKTEALEDSADGYYAERDANEKSIDRKSVV